MEKIYGMHKSVGLQLFLSGTPTFSSGTPTFYQMGVLNSCFQNPSESSGSGRTMHMHRLICAFNASQCDQHQNISYAGFLTFYLIEMRFNTLANRADSDQAALIRAA